MIGVCDLWGLSHPKTASNNDTLHCLVTIATDIVWIIFAGSMTLDYVVISAHAGHEIKTGRLRNMVGFIVNLIGMPM